MLEQIVKPLLSWYDGHARVLPLSDLGIGDYAAADEGGGSQALF